MEEELKMALEKAKESDRLKSAFLTNMSHEIRTPMNGILGFSDLLKEPTLNGQERDKYIEIIEKSGRRMLNTINDIVDMSKIQADQVKINETEFSIFKLLDEQYAFFKPEAQSKNIELISLPSLSKNEGIILTDRFKLEGILINLIKNAIKFTEEGRVVFGCGIKQNDEDNSYLEFFVKDTGIGIPKDRIDAIFNRFEQADIEDVQVFEGSGLGLAISKSYIEMLGGKIWVVSESDKGSTFRFTIPIKTKHLKQNKSTEEDTSEILLDNLSVIIAEDDTASIRLFDSIFKNKFCKITYAKNGKETIDELKKNPETDIILMDIKMPNMNGYQATRQIREFNKDVIIIAQTAFSLPGDREKAIEAGCNDYITKPINKKLLFEKIILCVNKKSI